MHTNTYKSLVSFTLYALLSTSVVVVAIPIQAQDAHSVVTKRLLGDVDDIPMSLYRRNGTSAGFKPPSRSPSISSSHSISSSQGISRPSTADSTNKANAKGADQSHIITICHAQKEPAVGKRGFFENTQYKRATPPTEEDNTVLKDFDPKYKHKVKRGPTINTAPISEGLYGEVYVDPSNSRQVIKHLGAPAKTAFDPFTAGQLRREITYLGKAQQLVKWEYTIKPNSKVKEVSEAWIWMKRVPGTSVRDLGFWAAGFPETVPDELQRGQPLRTTFLDNLVHMTVQKALQYATYYKVEHIDTNIGNIMVIIKANSPTYEIESVDLVDWGRARSVRYGCTPEKSTEIQNNVMASLQMLY